MSGLVILAAAFGAGFVLGYALRAYISHCRRRKRMRL